MTATSAHDCTFPFNLYFWPITQALWLCKLLESEVPLYFIMALLQIYFYSFLDCEWASVHVWFSTQLLIFIYLITHKNQKLLLLQFCCNETTCKTENILTHSSQITQIWQKSSVKEVVVKYTKMAVLYQPRLKHSHKTSEQMTKVTSHYKFKL